MFSITPHPTTNPARPVSILVIRVSAIGDVLMASPVAQALREAYPDAHIAWVVEPLSAPFARANPYVDEVIEFELTTTWRRLAHAKQFGALLHEVRMFIRKLRERRFDMAIDCQGLLKSGLINRFSRAPRRLGPLPAREASGWCMTEGTPWPKAPTHLADKYLAMLAPLGIPATPRRPILNVPAEDRDSARDFLAERGLISTSYVAFCISSSRLSKDWPLERWGELADLLWKHDGLRTVLIAGPERKAEAAELSKRYPSRPIAAAGHLSLLQSAAIVQDAVGVVGVDTGLTYAGMPTDTPTVALYGSTDAHWLTEEPHTAIILHKRPCSPCGRHSSCQGRYDCMWAITVAEVAETLRSLITKVATT